jgi:nicotinamide-nucleotide amidase
MMFEKKGVIIISMPGVPHEMKGMMTDQVIPLIRQKLVSGFIIHRTLLTAGIGESALAEHISKWEAALPSQLKLAYLPNYGMVRLRITGTGADKEKLESEINRQFIALKNLVQEWLVTDEDISMTQLVSRMLKERKKKLGTAESCTGGYISHLITSEPGSSEIFNGAIICYSNEVKKDILEVKEETLAKEGAVSEETVREMVRGAIKKLKIDYCIATSGIMGPDGGTPVKPVGTVWIGIGDKENIITRKFQFRFDRLRNIEMTATNALNLLRKVILETAP